LQRLEDAGIDVVQTDLEALRDSNPGYSLFWRLFVRPFGNQPGLSTISNPLDSGRVSLRSVLSMLNFKANHRKLMVADAADDYRALVSSANPHDGSSLHSNLGIQFSGPAAMELYQIESKLITFSTGRTLPPLAVKDYAPTKAKIKILTEGRIREALLRELEQAQDRDQIDIAVFYLSERSIIRALKSARQRGAKVRVLLDPNKDAFGRKKSGVPNRPVAKELTEAGIEVRWCATNGEQCHSKWLLSRPRVGNATLILGSANFTRRNLNDFNLETNVAYRGSVDDRIIVEAGDLFAQRWNNEGGEQHSYDYGLLPELSRWYTLKYRFMEFTGMSTF
ncbi:MAG TPA: phospholipase, partial [Gammaproteobacteria bacterium]|nr:phospholipase [Gammaproteobacteria bacterium]